MLTTTSWYEPNEPPGHPPSPGSRRRGGRRRRRPDPARKYAQSLRKHAEFILQVADRIEEGGTASEAAPAPTRPEEEEKVKRLARSGVIDYDVRFRPDGWADVHVNGIDLVLPPTRANLLVVLAEDNGRCDDTRLVGWKPLEEVLDALEKRIGYRPKRRSFWMIKCRLRESLEQAGLSRFFVEKNSDNEMRFTRRRADAA